MPNLDQYYINSECTSYQYIPMRKQSRSFKENRDIFNIYLQKHKHKVNFVQNDLKANKMNPRKFNRSRMLTLKEKKEDNKKPKQLPQLPLHKLVSDPESLNIALIGDCGVGKTSMIISYTSDNFPSEHQPTIFDNYVAHVGYQEHQITINFWDTSAESKYAQLRQACCMKADLILICFSMVDKQSLNHAVSRWLPEAISFNGKAKRVFVGTKADVHKEYLENGNKSQEAISETRISEVLENERHFCCSALTQKGLNEAFTWVIDRGIVSRQKNSVANCQLI